MTNKTLEEELADELTASFPAPTAPVAPARPVEKVAARQFAGHRFMATDAQGYEHLDRILKLAFTQASDGKGKERHAFGPVGFQPWDKQPILANARQVGPGGLAQQVMKKAGESVGMSTKGNYAGAKAEALGAIVYAAALFKLYEEMEQAK